jgi:hypothetical protein
MQKYLEKQYVNTTFKSLLAFLHNSNNKESKRKGTLEIKNTFSKG